MTDVLARMLHAIDAADFDTIRASFTDPVQTDYVSLWGGSAESAPLDKLIAQWQEVLAGFGATHHQTGPIVERDGLLETHVTAHHWRPTGEVWTVYGHYVARVTDGRIAELTLQTYHTEGDASLPQIAAQRVSDS
jgi:hypothetical protein